MAWEHGNLKTDTNTYYNSTLFMSANIERNYWFPRKNIPFGQMDILPVV